MDDFEIITYHKEQNTLIFIDSLIIRKAYVREKNEGKTSMPVHSYPKASERWKDQSSQLHKGTLKRLRVWLIDRLNQIRESLGNLRAVSLSYPSNRPRYRKIVWERPAAITFCLME